ncbi:MAG: AsmA family protein, partial [Limnohabitans sp.]
MKHLSDSDNPKSPMAEPDLKSKSVGLRVVNGLLALVVLAWLAVLLAWSALHIFIVPRIDDYRDALQQQASQAIGLRVDIGSIQARGGWLVPWFEINEIQLSDRDGRQALHLPRVLVAISPRSVLRGQFEQIDIESPELEIRKDANGHVWVAGLDATRAGDGSAADWVFSQPQWVVRQGVVHWRDESRPQQTQGDAPVLTLQGVEVSLVNQWFRHEIRADFTPPEAFGQRLTLQGKFHQAPWLPAGDFSHWSGDAFANLPFVNLATLRQWVPMDKGLSLQEGRGALRLWSDIRQGVPVGITADMALDAVQARLGADLLPLSLRHVHGRLGAQWQANSVEISTQDLVFDTQEGEHWPGGVLRVSWSGDDLASGTLNADRLDLEAMTQISQRLPLPEKWRALLARVQPQGQVNQLKATWHRQAHDGLNYSLHGQVRQFHVKRDTP